MERVENDLEWSLFCPAECPGLNDTWGNHFEELYSFYEKNGKARKVIRAQELWFKIIETQIECGVPYQLYKDSCNRKTNQSNLGTIKSSNLCVSGDTMILTSKGQIQISELENKKVEVWNGEEFNETIIRKTAKNQNLLKINFSNGVELDCTSEHKFYIQSGNRRNEKKYICKRAEELEIGDKLIKYNLPPPIKMDNINDIKYQYTAGFHSGDGTYQDKEHKHPKIPLFGKKMELIKYMDYNGTGSYDPKQKCFTIILPNDIKEKFFVPMTDSIESKLKWFEGLCDADATLSNNNQILNLCLSSNKKDFLIKIKLMLQTLGTDSKISLGDKRKTKIFPNRHKDILEERNVKPVYRLLIHSTELLKLKKIGFSPKRLQLNDKKPEANRSKYIKVVSIEDGLKNVDTYCFNEPKRHMGFFNGLQTGNCTESKKFNMIFLKFILHFYLYILFSSH